VPTDPTLYRAVQVLAGSCDGAVSADGVGFSGPDARFGKQIATISPDTWSDDVQRTVWKMLAKYRDQLARAGIDYASIPEPSGETSRKKPPVRVVDVVNGKVLVFLPYGDPAYPKTALSAIWNRDAKGWQVAVAKYGHVLTWAARNGIVVSERAKAVLETAPAPDRPQYAGTAAVERGEIVIRFDYQPSLIDAIRSIPGRRWDANERAWIVPHETASLVKQIAAEYELFLTDDVKRLPDHEIKLAPKISARNGEFALTFNYNTDVLAQVRMMPGARWSSDDRVWLVPVESANEVRAFINQHGAKISVEAEQLLDDASLVQEVIEASAAKDAEISVASMGNERLQLFPFQRAGVAYAMRAMGYEHDNGTWSLVRQTEGGVLIGDEMGLGKTVQGMACLQAANAFPAVIVCPASLKLNWERELHSWLPHLKVKVLGGTQGNVPDADVYVVNYDVLTHWVERFPPLGGIVLDESQYIKNGAAQRSKASVKLADKVKSGGVRVCLSGTPIVNQPLELITQLRVIGRLDDFGGATRFRSTYGNASPRNLAALNRKLRSLCYVRRRKMEVLTELPPKMWSEILIEGDPAVMKEYKKAEADIVKYLSELAMKLALESGATSDAARKEAWKKALRARAAEQLVAISTLKQLAARAKMTVAKQWVEDFLANDKKLVVFGWHRTVVDDVATSFANGVKIQGGMSSEKRQEYVDLFQTSDEQKVIACNIKAAGVGLTLTAASDVLFIEQGWTPSDMEQAADRCHRIGQTDSVTAWLMLTAGTIDEDISALIAHKRTIVDRAIDGSDSDDEEEGQSIVGDLLISLAERGMSETD